MKRLAVVIMLAAAGCGVSARHTATRIVAASDVVADTLAQSWAVATDARVAECRAKNLRTPSEREQCLGALRPSETDKVLAAVSTLVAAQLAVKAAAECEELQSCAAKTDWLALAAAVRRAWDTLVPYVRAVKGL